MLKDDRSQPFHILDEESPVAKVKASGVKWSKYKKYLSKKCNSDKTKRKHVAYIETISVSSAKRAIVKIFRNIFVSRYTGYEKFLTEEEKRFIIIKNNRDMVEDIKY